MSSVVSICNMALANIGTGKAIESINENSKEAKACKLFYDVCRESLLCAFNWNFSTVTEQLAESVNKHWKYEHTYAYPSKALRINKIINKSVMEHPRYKNGFEYVIERYGSSRFICTDCPEAVAVITYNVDVVDEFPMLFVETLAYKLACEIILPVTGGNMQSKQALYQLYKTKEAEAVLQLANEQRQQTDDSEFDEYGRARGFYEENRYLRIMKDE